MSHSFSIHKSTTAFQLLLAGVTGSLLAFGFVPTMTPQLEESVSQLAVSNAETSEVEEQFSKGALVLAAAVVGSVAVGVAFKSKKDSKETTISNIEKGNRKLQRRLLTLLHEDKAAANRLLTQATLKYPNRTADWYLEKVIYDLERDRGGY